MNKEAKSFKGKEIFNEFSKKIYHSKKEIKKIIAEESANHKIIGAYGAPAKATTALNFFGISGRTARKSKWQKLMRRHRDSGSRFFSEGTTPHNFLF